MQFRNPLAATALALGLGFGGATAFAQDATTEAPATGAPAEAPAMGATEAPAPAAPSGDVAFSDEQLQSFVSAALEVSGIQQEAASQLMNTAEQSQQDEVLQDANQQMIAAIEAEPGITVPEYIAIAEAAESDPALRAQLEEMIVAAQTQ